MLPDRVSNPGPMTNESSALPIALSGLAHSNMDMDNSSGEWLHIQGE